MSAVRKWVAQCHGADTSLSAQCRTVAGMASPGGLAEQRWDMIISFEDFCKKTRNKKQPSAAPSPPYLLFFRFHLLPAAFVSCLALSFNFALLFECANP
jgi:hypothetical protein